VADGIEGAGGQRRDGAGVACPRRQNQGLVVADGYDPRRQADLDRRR
jgi:hypothetical protein